MYSKENQKLIYWLISDIANWQNDKAVGSKVSEYELYRAKKDIKKHYLKIIGYSPRPNAISNFTQYIGELPIGDEMKNEIIKRYARSLQDFLIGCDDFSLALNMMTQEGASKFTSFLFEFCLENDIPLRKEISTLYAEQENRKFIYACLLNKKCAICGKHADLHHFDSIGSNGYDSDTGTNYRLMPLCRKHHTLFHNIGVEQFINNYKMEGIFLKEEEVPRMKKIYPQHFRGFKKEEK